MCPKIVNREEKRGEILEAALKTFVKHGYHATRMDTIAEEANIAKGTIYLYFKSKEDILVAAMKAEFAKMGSKLEEYRQLQGSTIDRIVATIRAHIGDVRQFADTHPLAVEILSSKELCKKLALSKLFEEWDRNIMETISSMIVEGQRRGEINKSIVPRDFVDFMQASGDGIQYQYFMARHPMERVERQIRELEKAVRLLLSATR